MFAYVIAFVEVPPLEPRVKEYPRVTSRCVNVTSLSLWRAWTPGVTRNHQVGGAVRCHLLAVFCSERWQLKCLVCHYNGYILLGICSRCSLPALALCCFVSMKFNRCRSSGGSKAHTFEWWIPYDRTVSFLASTVAVSTWPTDRRTKRPTSLLTPWGIVLLEWLTVLHLVSSFPHTFGIRRCMLCLQGPANYLCPEPDESSLRLVILFLKVTFYCYPTVFQVGHVWIHNLNNA